MLLKQAYQEKIYAGVLGKMIGVYLGRPVEGWPYKDIQERFGELPYYVNDTLKTPLIVADDDLSGMFAFFRAVRDSGFNPNLSAEQIGDAWLNYIIENRTILWWGGLGNSTEHTAYLHLKHGITAPQSGSIAQNGRVLAEQIGAQIFMDAFAMACPGDPEHAARLVRAAASVSHDGVAVDAARFLAALEASAFDERDLTKLFDSCERFIECDELKKAVADTREICAKSADWREVRNWLDEHYGYHHYSGPCHMIPNHTMVLASILMAGNDFAQSVKIGASAAWDTDCNAGNVGCFNGIRLGLSAMESGPDLRTPIADRTFVITSDGGEGISDAVKETRHIIAAACAFLGCENDQPKQRFAFEHKGSVQGFQPCPCFPPAPAGLFTLKNRNEQEAQNGLSVHLHTLAEGTPARVSVATFLDIHEEYSNYETFVSPTLYTGQTVTAVLECTNQAERYPAVTPYLWYADAHGQLQLAYGAATQLAQGKATLNWLIPSTGGMPVCRFGFEFTSIQRCATNVVICTVDWANTPKLFEQKGVLMQDMWDLNPFWAKAFVSSAASFAPNLNWTYCISHPDENGVATIGTHDFTNYTVASTLSASLHRQCGLVAHAVGHRRYYGAVLRGGTSAAIIKRCNDIETTLCEAPFYYSQFTKYQMNFTVKENAFSLSIDGKSLLLCEDSTAPYLCGGAGFLVDTGAMFIDGFSITNV